MQTRKRRGSPAVGEFLRGARMNYQGDVVPSIHGRPRPVPLSQFDVAVRRGVSLTTVGLQERGVVPIPIGQLDDVAASYGLTPAQRDELYLLRTGGYPPVLAGEPDPEATSGWADYIRSLAAPALTIDRTWTVRFANDAWKNLFEPAGRVAPSNLLRFVLLHPYAKSLLGGWAHDWALPFLHQLRLDLGLHDAPELRRLVARVQSDAVLAGMWAEAAAPTPASSLHSDGLVRYIKPPASEHLHSVRLLVSSPMHDPRRRVITLNPTRESPNEQAAQHRTRPYDQQRRGLDSGLAAVTHTAA